MGNIYLIGKNRDDVFIIPPDDDNYYWFLERAFYHLNTIKQKSYGATNGLKNRIQSLHPGIALQDAVYWIPSSYDAFPNGSTTRNVLYITGSATHVSQSYIEILDEYTSVFTTYTSFIPTGIRNSSGVQQTGSLISSSFSMIDISSSIASGGRWFASLYRGQSDDYIPYSINPFINGLTNIADGTDMNQLGYPFEIDRVIRYSNYSHIIFKDTVETINSFMPIGGPVREIGARGSIKNYGLILTKSLPSNQVVMYGDKWQNFSVTAGYVTTLYPKPLITQEAKYITSTYGNRP